ncbi:MAG: bacterial Ig-like domain-containing protein, partial [Bacteroidaceae bacterium]|nr:bacterial Ig-like domain-containing protein [Bacteroidaceae bacterium]
SDPTEIFIASSDLPRVKYVEGQELELKGGALTVVVGGSPERMPLDNEAISVTGYDKNTIGKQTLTVTYNTCRIQAYLLVLHHLSLLL